MVSTTNTKAALREVKTAFRRYSGVRKLRKHKFEFYFKYEQWWVTNDPRGLTWEVGDTSDGLDFKRL